MTMINDNDNDKTKTLYDNFCIHTVGAILNDFYGIGQSEGATNGLDR